MICTELSDKQFHDLTEMISFIVLVVVMAVGFYLYAKETKNNEK